MPQTIIFDDARYNYTGQVPNGYDGLNWTNFYVGSTSIGGGYTNAAVSGSNFAYNGGGDPATISPPSGSFELLSGYFTAAWNDGLTVTVTGFSGSTVIDTMSFTVNTSGPTLENFNWSGLTSVQFASSGGTHNPAFTTTGTQFAMDNLTVNISPAPTQTVHNDFNGDGRSDLLLRNNDGSLAEWNGQSIGRFVGNPYVNYPLGTDWQVVGTGDFNGDGRSDLLLRNTNGLMAEWTGQADGSFVGNSAVNYPLGTDWQVAAIGDFNGDGRSDLLLRNTKGMIAEWTGQLDGSFTGNPHVNYPLGTDWQIVGAGDFNGDGRSDLLLRNINGTIAEWMGQPDGSFTGNPAVNYPLGTDWQVAAIGDFNGDGRSDILLRNTNGMMAEWAGQPDGSFVGNPGHYPLSADWHVAATGDFNGDGRSDILLRNDNGSLAEWIGQADGSFISNANANYPMGLAWHVQDPAVHDTIV